MNSLRRIGGGGSDRREDIRHNQCGRRLGRLDRHHGRSGGLPIIALHALIMQAPKPRGGRSDIDPSLVDRPDGYGEGAIDMGPYQS